MYPFTNIQLLIYLLFICFQKKNKTMNGKLTKGDCDDLVHKKLKGLIYFLLLNVL